MENASKALLIAGGIMLVMLIIGVVIFAWNSFSEFYKNKEKLTEIDNVTAFNSQITSYDRSKVHGYELITLANKIADYNMQYSSSGTNNQNYTPITMSFTMTVDQTESLRFSKTIPNVNGDEIVISQKDKLFTRTRYEQSTARNEILEQIFNEAVRIEDIYKGRDIATKLAKSINSLVLSKEQLDYNYNQRHMSYSQSKANSVITYNNIVNEENKVELDTTNMDTNLIENYINNQYKIMINKIINEASIMKYYEFYQFKRGIFKCDTNSIRYNASSGRIENISFIFTGKIE